MVRDTAKQTGREVNIVIEGENTDLDKSILDALAEPMMHLLRNAVDHGIEPPLERAAAGKPPEGTIRLNAYHQGNQVVIEVSDDGQGIDLPEVVADGGRTRHHHSRAGRASERKRCPRSDLPPRPQHLQRGHRNQRARRRHGRRQGRDGPPEGHRRACAAFAGEGTTFRLKVPLTLAIIKALLFRVSERLYAVPLGNVLEILRARESEIHFIDGQEVLQIREEVVPLIRLSRMHPGGERKVQTVHHRGQPGRAQGRVWWSIA